MPRTIIVEAEEKVACPKCSHPFPLTEGISRQSIERHAEDIRYTKRRLNEIYVHHTGRTYEEGKKIGWRDGVAAFWHIVRYNVFVK